MKMFTTAPSDTTSKVEEPKEFDYTKTVIYPSGARGMTIKLAFLKWDYDLDVMSKDCDVMVTHNLVTPLNGHRKAISNKRYRSFVAKQDLRGADGKVHTKAGATAYAYDSDKFKTCVLATAMNNSKLAGDTPAKFRRSLEIYVPCFVYTVEAVEKDTGKKETKEINKVWLVGFSVGDLYSKSFSGVGKDIMKNYNDIPKKNKLSTHVFEYTANGLVADENLTDEQLELITGLRNSVDTYLSLESTQLMFPAKYDDLEQALENGTYDLKRVVENKTKFTPKTPELESDDELPPF